MESAAKKAAASVVETQPEVTLSDDECLQFLKDKLYQSGKHPEEEVVFSWLIDQEKLWDDPQVRPQLDAYVDFLANKGKEALLARLKWMSERQMNHLVKLFGDRIEILWKIEAESNSLPKGTRKTSESRFGCLVRCTASSLVEIRTIS